jgi:uracil phosphoribosyltransferase
MSQRLVVVDHPVLADRLTVLRDKNTDHGTFRQALYSTLRSSPPAGGPAGGDRHRPGVAGGPEHGGRLPAALAGARVGHVGVDRDEQEHRPVDYYERLPPGLPETYVFVVDSMLATGGSAVHPLNRLKAAGASRLALVCLVVAPEGLEAVERHHPDVVVWTAAVDRELDQNAYVRPGLGDAGDRVSGTA